MTIEQLVSQITEALKASKPKTNMNHKEAAEYLGISVSYLEEIKAAYQIPFCRIGGRVIYRVKDLDKFLSDRIVYSPENDRRA